MSQRVRQILITVTLTVLALLAHAAPARADLTAFWGLTTTPVDRQTHGFSIGITKKVLGGEFEWANTGEKTPSGAPAIRTYSFNGLVQIPGRRTNFYVTGGWGRYRETLALAQDSGAATNIGGGLKFRIIPLIKLRVDYGVFSFRGPQAIVKTPRRFYVGVTLGI